LHLSPVQVGALLSAFFYTYAGLQLIPISGWLADRFPVGYVFAAGFIVWSVATLATGVVSGFAAIFVTRLVLGAGESIAYPCYSRIFASAIPQHHRGRANALLDAGSKLGPALSTFLGGLLLVRFGWRVFFVVLGVAGLVWLLPWFKFMPRLSGASRPDTAELPSTIHILTFRSAWGTFAGHFCGNYFWFFLLTWLPSYLEKERAFSIERMANVSSLAYLVIAASTVTAGWLSDRAIARGASPTVIRKTIVVAGLSCSAIILPVAFVTGVGSCITFLLLSCIAFGAYTSNHWAITQTLAGPMMAGRWTSLQNGIGNLSGLLAASLTGYVVQTTGSFRLAFIVAAAVAITGGLTWLLVVGRVEPVERIIRHYPSPAEIQTHS
jgi:MFS family permease